MKLRSSILSATKLEVKANLESFKTHYCEAVKVICSAYLHGFIVLDRSDSKIHKIIAAIFEEYHADLLDYSTMSRDEFYRIYLSTHNLEELPTTANIGYVPFSQELNPNTDNDPHFLTKEGL